MKAVNILVLLAVAAAAIYAVVVLAVYVLQREFLFFPTQFETQSALSIWTVGDSVYGYSREVPGSKRVWLMMHGNAGQAAHRDYILGCVGPADSVFVLEYPGYGSRSGSPSRDSFNDAAAVAYRKLREEHPGVFIGVIGESIGSGPACSLAAERQPPDAIVLITPFDTLVSVAGKLMPFLPVRWLLKDKWDNVQALRGYRGPVIVYGAEFDTVIPVMHAKTLAQAVGARFELMQSGHNDWMRTGSVKLAVAIQSTVPGEQ
jgi:pimeloyl-ACP methyl ester carboxylesterase